MKKEKLQGFLVGASTMAILMGGLTFAANRSETVQRYFRDIKIKLNGTEITPKDATGKVVEPFLIEGTTYLPVRAVGEAMGLNVDWNGEESTVLLTDENNQKGAVYLELKHVLLEDNWGKKKELDIPQIVSKTADTSLINQSIKNTYQFGNVSFYSSNYQDIFSFAWRSDCLEGDGPSLPYAICNFNNKTGELLSNEDVIKLLGKTKEEMVDRYKNVLMALAPKVYLDLGWNNGYLGTETLVNSLEEYMTKIKAYSLDEADYFDMFITSEGDIYTWMPFRHGSTGGHFWAHEAIVNLTKGTFVEGSFNYELLNQIVVSKNYTEEVTASSTLPAQGNISYEASNLTDGKLNTVWSEGVEGNGIGETITIKRTYTLESSDSVKKFNLLYFQNGYGVSSMNSYTNRWGNNGRVKELDIYFNGRFVATKWIDENSGSHQLFDISYYDLSVKDGEECTFTFEIKDVYPGEVYEDTVISEIGIY